MNIYGIAQKCGVSIATVSRVLNNSPKVSPHTREKVLAVIDEEKYAPSALARSLGNGGSRQIGILCGDADAPQHSEMLGFLTAELREAGQVPLVQITGTSPQEQEIDAAALIKQGAAVLLAIGLADPTAKAHFMEDIAAQVPVVTVGCCLPGAGTYAYYCDEKEAMAAQVKILHSRLRRHILFLYCQDSASCSQKLAGYRLGHRAVGTNVEESLIVRVDRSVEAVNACIKRLLVRRVTFDAILAAEDMPALGAQKALSRIGLSMPIIGCHNTRIAQYASPELTSIDTDDRAQCAAAVKAALALMDGEAAEPETRFPFTLIERDSFRRN